MNHQDLLRVCIQNLLRRKSRTFLTVLGVLIGCCSIVIMVSLGIGMEESQEKLLAQLGDLTIITVTAPQKGKGKKKLDDNLVSQIRAMDGVEAVTPKLSLDGYTCRLVAGSGKRYVADWATIAGMDTAQMERLGYKLENGSYPARSGEVAVGQYFAYGFRDTLRPEGSNTIDRWAGGFDEEGQLLPPPDAYFDPLAQPLTLEIELDNGTVLSFPLKPSGTVREDTAKGYETSDGLLMSIADLRAIQQKARGGTGQPPPYESLVVKVTDISRVEKAESAIKTLGYTTESMESIRKPMEKEARQKQMMLGGLGAISLFVAALGITNTMIMSISERTKEIGVMKSLGCYVYDIRVMFLTEAGVIGLLGGLVGCVISFFISVTVNLVAMGEFSVFNILPAIVGSETVNRVSVIPPWLYLFAVAFSVLIGLGSGYYPANKAVQIPALEAIKSE